MPGVVLDDIGAKAAGSGKRSRREPLTTVELKSALATVPGIEHLAQRAHDQMLRACRDMNRSFPETSAAPGSPDDDPLDPVALEGLIENGTSGEEPTRRLGVLALLWTVQNWPESADALANLVSDFFWLECESRLPALSLALAVLDDDRKAQLAKALRQLATTTSEAGRGQKCLALIWARALSGDAGCLRAVLDTSGGWLADPSRSALPISEPAGQAVRGRVLATPRGPWMTAIAAFTGWMLIRHLFACVSRYVLAYRAQAELSVSERGIEIHEHTMMLGRRLRERTRLISLQTVRSLSREVRYAHAGTYAGLAALAVGSFVGIRLVVDGLRAPGFSGPTMAIGLLIVLAGLALDFAAANWLNPSRAQCRLLIETVGGRGLYLTCDEPSKVDGMLLDLANKLAA